MRVAGSLHNSAVELEASHAVCARTSQLFRRERLSCVASDRVRDTSLIKSWDPFYMLFDSVLGTGKSFGRNHEPLQNLRDNFFDTRVLAPRRMARFISVPNRQLPPRRRIRRARGRAAGRRINCSTLASWRTPLRCSLVAPVRPVPVPAACAAMGALVAGPRQAPQQEAAVCGGTRR